MIQGLAAFAMCAGLGLKFIPDLLKVSYHLFINPFIIEKLGVDDLLALICSSFMIFCRNII